MMHNNCSDDGSDDNDGVDDDRKDAADATTD